MKGLRMVCSLAVLVAVSSRSSIAAAVVIAGSDLNAPPAFLENSFWAVIPETDRAFPFTVIQNGPFRVQELQIAAYHYQGLAGSSASFSLHEDLQGEPGDRLIDFEFHDISTIEQVHAAAPSSPAILEANTRYWIVGQTPQGQVNWSLGGSLGSETFGQVAYRMAGGEWTIQEIGNVSAFAILGTPVPEPTNLAVFCAGVFGSLCYYRRLLRPVLAKGPEKGQKGLTEQANRVAQTAQTRRPCG